MTLANLNTDCFAGVEALCLFIGRDWTDSSNFCSASDPSRSHVPPSEEKPAGSVYKMSGNRVG